MKTFAVIAGLIALLGIVGTPDYVLDVERENESLRAQLFQGPCCHVGVPGYSAVGTACEG